jgi:protein-tyrosine phosphatase
MERRIAMDGAVNLRDLGGYPAGAGRRTRWRRVLRSDSLAELSEADLGRLAGLGLHGLVDFRLPAERRARPNRLPPGHGLRVREPGFIPRGTEAMLEAIREGRLGPEGIRREVLGHYRLFAEEHLPDYLPAFRLILEAEGRPVLLHCTSGKDRTGFGAALVLLAAGAAEAVAVADYALTDRYRRDIRFMFRDGIAEDALAMLTSARPEYLEAALARLRGLHGGPEGWLAAMGLDAGERAALRRLLSEPA